MQYKNGKRYFTMAQFCEQRYGGRIVKIPLSFGCSCPNRDGSRGTGGCAFCLIEQKQTLPLSEQYREGCARLLSKWPGAKPVGYAQDFSNTHLPPKRLAALLEETAALPGIAGVRLATRADCIDEEKVSLLASFQRTWGLPVEIELGLQTACDKTALALNRCHSFSEFVAGYRLLAKANLYTCVHLINGLPGESAGIMRETAENIAALRPGGVKIHMLHLLEGTPLAAQYQTRPFALLSREQYAEIVCDQLERLPPDTAIERLTGDGAADRLVAPAWTRHKHSVLNLIDQILARRDTHQGALWREKETK